MPLVRTQLEQNNKLSSDKEDLVRFVREIGSVDIDEFSNRIDDLRELISTGFLQLKVVTYVWGVEFLVTVASKKDSY